MTVSILTFFYVYQDIKVIWKNKNIREEGNNELKIKDLFFDGYVYRD